jgi:hypothetical protein
MNKQKRVRLNSEIRNRLAIQFRNHLENENTQEREAFLQSREAYPKIEKTAFETAKEIVSRVYPKEDVEKAKYLSDKFQNIDIYRKDSCFNFSFTAEAEERRYNSHTNQNETIKVVKPQDKHFTFGLRGSTTGCSYDSQSDFALAMYREELKTKPNCNPDILIEQENDSPYKRKFMEANDKFFGFDNPKNENSIVYKYAKDFELEVLGSSYCNSRVLKADNTETEVLEKWLMAKQKVIDTHAIWIKTILDQVKIIKQSLHSYKYFDEAFELAKTLNLDLKEVEEIKENSSSLTIFNPNNVASLLQAMKNKKQTREDKIKSRLLYEKQQQANG